MDENNTYFTPSRSSAAQQNEAVAKQPPSPHQNDFVEPQSERQSPSKSKTSTSTSPCRTLKTPSAGSRSEGDSGPSKPWAQNLSSALAFRTRITAFKSKVSSRNQEEPEALVDLIFESQSQRLENQRANFSLLPDPGPAAICGACSSDQTSVPGLDFYYMLIQFQSDRMEDQRCSLPHLDDVIGLAPEGQEDFFSLIQRVQSRRMDEQRASMVLDTKGEGEPAVSAHQVHITIADEDESAR
uniref:G-protein signaling modulator 1a n=1 Tax=Nothobranchius kuhntae TaxID=321403 RepID=A0A1A8J4M6_NOTKU